MEKTASCDLVDPIAVVGLSGRFPKAQNLNALWNLLSKAKISTNFVSDSELEN